MSDDRSYRAVSRGFPELVQQVEADPQLTFDVVIVGSGYGAAMAAHVFATRRTAQGNAVSVCVLERGNEYLPGMFPARFAELPAHVRYTLPAGNRNNEGLFDIRFSPSVTTILANGVGGGSLINAGVMERAAVRVFESGWPAALKANELRGYYRRARALLGARRFTTDPPAPDLPTKFYALRDLDSGHHRPARITVEQQGGVSSGGFRMDPCIRCGDCATGCNHNAKISLDVSVLGRAARHPNCNIYTGATVLCVEPAGDIWRVRCVHTNEDLRRRAGGALDVRARHVILAAGTLGTVEILRRSTTVPVSDLLGERASTNGDMMVVDYDTLGDVNAVADEAVAPAARGVGPTITGIIDWRRDRGKPNLVIEDMAVPGPLRRLFRDLYGTVAALHAVAERDGSRHRRGFPADDPYAVDDRPLRRTAVYAVMGDDLSGGATVSARVEVPVGAGADYRDGVATLASEGFGDNPLFRQQVRSLETLTAATGGRIIPNPLWQPLPMRLQWLMLHRRGPLVTVHPLGGCVMADNPARGVVDDIGRVFKRGAGTPPQRYCGLAVLDGSVIPTALGINPALTIAAVALRGAENLAAVWGYQNAGDPDPQPEQRSVYRAITDGFASRPTEVEVVERLSGPVRFRAIGEPHARTRIVELTLFFLPKPLDHLMRTSGDPAAGAGARPELELDAERSRLRVFEQTDWENLQRATRPEPQHEENLNAAALVRARLSGRLVVFERQPSFAWWRIVRALAAWFVNRGARDIWQNIGAPAHPDDPGIGGKLAVLVALASRAGEKRALRYDIRLHDVDGALALRDDRLIGIKTFTYALRSNPFNQLMRVALRKFPGACRLSRPRTLSVDLPFFVRRGVPLFHVTNQQDAAVGIADLLAFFSYFLRLLLGVHVWAFRKPDDDPRSDAEIRRLPQDMEGLPPRQVYDIPVQGDVVRLTRYPGPVDADHPPLLMIHGYSIGGTTFAHHAVHPNAARYFHAHGRDVWIVDLRTSPGLPSATKPWRFEDVAMLDIPLAVERICALTGAAKVDVLAHCMGAAMFSMAVLRDAEGRAIAAAAGAAVALENLPTRIRRAVLSQIAPLMVLSPTNQLRGYIARYLLDFLPLGDYAFRPDDPDSFGNQLLDRVLSVLPYPEDEFFIENPLLFWRQTPWVRTRHRMDALYARDLEIRNVPRRVRGYIDDFCGPLNLRTVSQTLHFAELFTIANHRGENSYVTRKRVGDRWGFPTLSVHGERNALSDVRTVYRMKEVFKERLGRSYDFRVQPGAGHLDWLLGTPQRPVFERIRQFFEVQQFGEPVAPEEGYIAHAPWIGPILSTVERAPAPDRVFVRLGSHPSLSRPSGVVLLNVKPGVPVDVLAEMVYVVSCDLAKDRWATVEVPPALIPEPGWSLLVLVVFPEVAGIGFPMLQDQDYLQVQAGLQVVRFRLVEGLPGEPEPMRELLPFVTIIARAVSLALKELRSTSLTMPVLPLPTRMDAVGDELTRARIAWATSQALAGPPALIRDGLVEYDRNDRDDRTTAFALGSCQFLPGLLDGPMAGRSYRRLMARIENDDPDRITPKFVVLTGDQVYADIRAGIYDPTQQDDRYTTPYVRWLRMRSVRDVFRHVPSVMTLDDHEIDNNWEPIAAGAPNEQLHKKYRSDGVKAFRRYQRRKAPPWAPLWQAVQLKGARLFLMDTRTMRTRRTAATSAGASLLDPLQWNALSQWLDAHANEPKFVVSPAMVLPRLLQVAADGSHGTEALCSDGWDGYPKTLQQLVRLIADKSIGKLVFLSGDEHRACIATVEVHKGPQHVATFHSIHTPGLYAPFPSGNASPARFRQEETYLFDGYVCDITAQFPGGDDYNGFTYLALEQTPAADWVLHVEYDDIARVTLGL